MGDNEELVDKIGEGMQSLAEQIPGLSKRIDSFTSKFNEAKPQIAKGIKMTAVICR